VRAAAAQIRGPGGEPPRALDLGCGSGNVTGHLLAAGFAVTAADVAPEFLRTVRRRYGVATLRLNGIDLAGVPDGSFELAAAYSVLHHIPDYLAMVAELARVVRPGGVVMLDHEANEHFWGPDGCAHHFRAEVLRRRLERPGLWNPERRRWQRYLMPSKYVFAVRQRIDPLFWLDEADIHVWPADHIEWAQIERVVREAGADVLRAEDYLVFRAGYPRDLWDAHRDRCADMRLLVARRRPASR
jgi:SAM-dependent methyltransferase